MQVRPARPQYGLGIIHTCLSALKCTPEEWRSLQFFTEKTVGQLATFFPDALWNTIVLKLAQSETSILHALVALSSYHESYLSSESSIRDGSPFALREYNLAIRNQLNASRVCAFLETDLITCLIFISIEILRGRYDAAIGLFSTGFRMIQTYGSDAFLASKSNGLNSGGACQDLMQVVEPAFVRLAVQVSQIVGDIDPSNSVWPVPDYDLPTTPLDPHFTSMAEARNSIVSLAIECIKSHPQDTVRYSVIARRLHEWSQAFDALSVSRNSVADDPSQRRGEALLKLQHRYLVLRLATADLENLADPSIMNENLEVVREMIKYAALALGLESANGEEDLEHPSNPQREFHMEIGAVPILCGLSIHCHDPLIRRQTISLMRNASIQEGLWSGLVAAGVAEKILALEDSETETNGTFLPEAKLRVLQARFHPDKSRMTMVLSRGQTQFEEVIEY